MPIDFFPFYYVVSVYPYLSLVIILNFGVKRTELLCMHFVMDLLIGTGKMYVLCNSSFLWDK